MGVAQPRPTTPTAAPQREPEPTVVQLATGSTIESLSQPERETEEDPWSNWRDPWHLGQNSDNNWRDWNWNSGNWQSQDRSGEWDKPSWKHDHSEDRDRPYLSHLDFPTFNGNQEDFATYRYTVMNLESQC